MHVHYAFSPEDVSVKNLYLGGVHALLGTLLRGWSATASIEVLQWLLFANALGTCLAQAMHSAEPVGTQGSSASLRLIIYALSSLP